jgi:predicted transcriptional regulator
MISHKAAEDLFDGVNTVEARRRMQRDPWKVVVL